MAQPVWHNQNVVNLQSKTLLQRVTEQALTATTAPVVVVTGAEHDLVQQTLQLTRLYTLYIISSGRRNGNYRSVQALENNEIDEALDAVIITIIVISLLSQLHYCGK